MFLLANITAFTSLVIASITDIKTREVPDWLNYGLIIFGLGSRLIYSIALSDINFFLYGLTGFFVFFVIANLMFYSAQWGGGDSKLLMGLGAVIGLNFNFSEMPFLLIFWINIILIGAIYGLFWSFMIAFRNRKKFLKDFKERSTKSAKIRRFLLIICLAVVLSAFFIDSISTRVLLVTFVFSMLLIFYISIFIKSVEKTCMLKLVEPEKLTEGDWILNEMLVNKKKIFNKEHFFKNKDIKKILKIRNIVQVEVLRKFFFLNRKLTILSNEIKKGDLLLLDLKLRNLSIKKGNEISSKLYWKIKKEYDTAEIIDEKKSFFGIISNKKEPIQTPITFLKEGDKLYSDLRINNLYIKAGKRLSKKDIHKIKENFNYKYNTVMIKRKIFCFNQTLKFDELLIREGDIILNDLYFGKYVCGPKDLGIEKKQIEQLIQLKRKGLIKKVLIKEGIPFVPSFLAAFTVTLLFGNWLLLFI